MTRRLVAGYLALTAVVLVVLMVPLGITHRHNVEQDLLLRMERDAAVLASLVQDDLRAPSAARDAQVARVGSAYADDTGARVAVTDAEGSVLLDTDPPAPGERSLRTRPEVGTALGGRVATGSRYSQTLGTELLYVAVPVAAGGTVYGTVRVTYPASEVTEAATRYWWLLAAVGVVTLLAVAAIGWLIARWVARPLSRLEQAADRVGTGDLTVRAVEDQGPPEVRALAHRFNAMVGQVEQLVGAQEAFVADASHQLRTPLTAMRLRIENLGAAAGAAGQADADAALDEVDRLARMVDSLLALARAERGQQEPVRVDVSALVGDRAVAWQELAAEDGVAVTAQVEPGLMLRLPDGMLEQVVDNLVDNAVAVGAPEVVVGAALVDGMVRVSVTDTGPGMSPEERAHAFDRFWRATTSAPGGGTGLGLAIVRRLVEGAGGSVRLEEGPGGRGLRAVVALPRA
jgi:signal transduction histidine kinase